MKLLALAAAAALVAIWLFRRALPHDAFPAPLPNVDWTGW